jgi:hypothetical protein
MRTFRAEGKGLMAIAAAMQAEGAQIGYMGVKSVLRAAP